MPSQKLASRRLHLFPNAVPKEELVLLTEITPLHPWHPAIFRHFGFKDHFAMGRGQPTSKEVGPRNAARESLPQIFRTLTHLKHKLELVFHLGLSDMAPWPNYSGSSSFSQIEWFMEN